MRLLAEDTSGSSLEFDGPILIECLGENVFVVTDREEALNGQVGLKAMTIKALTILMATTWSRGSILALFKGHKNTGSTGFLHFQISRPRPPAFDQSGTSS